MVMGRFVVFILYIQGLEFWLISIAVQQRLHFLLCWLLEILSLPRVTDCFWSLVNYSRKT